MAADASDDAPTKDLYVNPKDQPGCHYDCFGPPWGCGSGYVAHNRTTPIPCAYFGTFPGGRPNCTSATWRCEGPLSCAGPTRYQACALGLDSVSDREGDARLVRRALCGSGALKAEGSPCAQDDDCRPSGIDIAFRLRCDVAAGRCVRAPRPSGLTAYGEPCGPPIAPGAVSYVQVVEGAQCARCLVAPAGGCAVSACTMPCDFDDDCPAGSTCVCAPGGRPSRLGLCAPGGARTFAELGRQRACDAGVDAGEVEDAGDGGDAGDAGAAACAAQRVCVTGRCDDPDVLGVAWDGSACVALHGCRVEGRDAVALYGSFDACIRAHLGCGGRVEHAPCPADEACPTGERCVAPLHGGAARCGRVASGCIGSP